MSDIAIFLTGTGTGVGKTVAGCIIAAHWAAQGRSPRVMKPAESGCALEGGRLVPRDALALKTAAGDPRPVHEICPYRYEIPLTPAHAAEREGGAPDLAREGVLDTLSNHASSKLRGICAILPSRIKDGPISKPDACTPAAAPKSKSCVPW